MHHLPQLARIQRAEQYFDFFDVTYDPRVLAVYRLRVLKRFGMEIARIDAEHPHADTAERILLYAAALRGAHDQFARRLAGDGEGDEPAAACPACAGCGTE
jgi:nitrogenase-stabilizing/protective protein